MTKIKTVLKYAAIILAIVVIDQLAKDFLLYLITGRVPVSGAAWSLVPMPYMMWRITSFFNIVFTWNPGTSFSLFRALGEAAPLIIVVATGFIIGFIGYYMAMRARSWERPALALIMGGAIGNLIDRVRFGAVIDFLDFHLGVHHWPAFNIADICICVGVGLYVLMWLIQQHREKLKNK